MLSEDNEYLDRTYDPRRSCAPQVGIMREYMFALMIVLCTKKIMKV